MKIEDTVQTLKEFKFLPEDFELKEKDSTSLALKAGDRFNEGKIRYDLLEPYAMEQLAKIFTFGAQKYADNNWLKGLPWLQTTASLKRHLAAFEKGEDYDKESGLLHMAHVAWNALAIVSYYKHRPEFDNRLHKHLKRPKIALDIDNVICDWTKAWGEKHGLPTRPNSWNFSYGNGAKFKVDKAELEEFYSKIPAQVKPEDIPFEPHCYITARSIDEELTKKWLEDNGFPCVPVYTVPFGQSKVEVAKKSGADWIIDDSYSNFVELNNAGICTFLYDAPHNQRYDVGYKRVKNFKDFAERFL